MKNSIISQNDQLPNLLSREEYDRAICRVDVIFFARKGTPEGKELDSLIDAIVQYEEAHFPFGDAEKK